jgi:adenylate cyclase class 2
MNTEIEVKFLDINLEAARAKLEAAGATCRKPMRLMKRAIMDFPDRRLQSGKSNGYVRVRDEGDKVTLTYKMFESLSIDGAKELETSVQSFDTTVAILTAIGLQVESVQETKRESWNYKGCAIELDVWPWLNPYMEIEGDSQHQVKAVASALGLDWNDAAFGDVMVAYRAQYPGLSESQTVGNLAEVSFTSPLPSFLQKSH